MAWLPKSPLEVNTSGYKYVFGGINCISPIATATCVHDHFNANVLDIISKPFHWHSSCHVLSTSIFVGQCTFGHCVDYFARVLRPFVQETYNVFPSTFTNQTFLSYCPPTPHRPTTKALDNLKRLQGDQVFLQNSECIDKCHFVCIFHFLTDDVACVFSRIFPLPRKSCIAREEEEKHLEACKRAKKCSQLCLYMKRKLNPHANSRSGH